MSHTVTHTAYSEAAPDAVWSTLVNISDWPTWDTRLETTRHSGTAKAGNKYTLKPHDGHEVSIEIVKADNYTFQDVAKLEFGTIETERTIKPSEGGCLVTQTMRATINPGSHKTFSRVFWDSWSQGIIDSTRALAHAPVKAAFVARHKNA